MQASLVFWLLELEYWTYIFLLTLEKWYEKGIWKSRKQAAPKVEQESFSAKELGEYLNSPELGRLPEIKLYAKDSININYCTCNSLCFNARESEKVWYELAEAIFALRISSLAAGSELYQ